MYGRVLNTLLTFSLGKLVRSRTYSRDSTENDSDSFNDEPAEVPNGEIPGKLKQNVRKEVLKLVVNLSSAVASKGSQQEIIS